MKNIFLIILIISCARHISSTSPSKKVSSDNSLEKAEEKKLEIDPRFYELTYTLEERNLYKIYKEDQNNILNNIIDEAINLIVNLEDRNDKIMKEFCNELTFRGIYTIYKDGRKDNIRVLVEDIILNQIYIALKPAMFNNLSSEETNKIFEEVYKDILSYLTKDKNSIKEESKYLENFLYKLFDEELNSYSTYKYLKNYLPNNVSYETKDIIFENVRTRKYEKIRIIFNDIRELYIKEIDDDFKIIEKEVIKIENSVQNDDDNSKEILIPSFLIFYENKIYYKGIPLMLREYKNINL